MAAPRAQWKGQLKLGLISCSVSLYTAVSEGDEVHLNMLNRKTGNRLQRQFVDSETDAVVEREEQVKGYTLENGGSVVLEEAEIEAAIPESTKCIEIEHFVPWDEVDTTFVDRPYYVAPSDAGSQEAFALIRTAMEEAEVAGLGRTVLFRRDRVLLLRPLGPGLLGETLHFAYEMRSAAKAFADIPKAEISGEMVELAEHIIGKKRGAFDPDAFEDRYEAALKELIRAKQAGEPIKPKPQPKQGNVVSLLEALRESAGADKKAADKKPTDKKPADKKPAAKARPRAEAS
jgi:DNA end-binding protein Ku